eukprot:320064_1
MLMLVHLISLVIPIYGAIYESYDSWLELGEYETNYFDDLWKTTMFWDLANILESGDGKKIFIKCNYDNNDEFCMCEMLHTRKKYECIQHQYPAAVNALSVYEDDLYYDDEEEEMATDIKNSDNREVLKFIFKTIKNSPTRTNSDRPTESADSIINKFAAFHITKPRKAAEIKSAVHMTIQEDVLTLVLWAMSHKELNFNEAKTMEFQRKTVPQARLGDLGVAPYFYYFSQIKNRQDIKYFWSSFGFSGAPSNRHFFYDSTGKSTGMTFNRAVAAWEERFKLLDGGDEIWHVLDANGRHVIRKAMDDWTTTIPLIPNAKTRADKASAAVIFGHGPKSYEHWKEH